MVTTKENLLVQRLEALQARYDELDRLLMDPKVHTQPAQLHRYAKEKADLAETLQAYGQYKELSRRTEETRQMLRDSEVEMELRQMA